MAKREWVLGTFGGISFLPAVTSMLSRIVPLPLAVVLCGAKGLDATWGDKSKWHLKLFC